MISASLFHINQTISVFERKGRPSVGELLCSPGTLDVLLKLTNILFIIQIDWENIFPFDRIGLLFKGLLVSNDTLLLAQLSLTPHA